MNGEGCFRETDSSHSQHRDRFYKEHCVAFFVLFGDTLISKGTPSNRVVHARSFVVNAESSRHVTT